MNKRQVAAKEMFDRHVEIGQTLQAYGMKAIGLDVNDGYNLFSSIEDVRQRLEFLESGVRIEQIAFLSYHKFIRGDL